MSRWTQGNRHCAQNRDAADFEMMQFDMITVDFSGRRRQRKIRDHMHAPPQEWADAISHSTQREGSMLTCELHYSMYYVQHLFPLAGYPEP